MTRYCRAGIVAIVALCNGCDTAASSSADATAPPAATSAAPGGTDTLGAAGAADIGITDDELNLLLDALEQEIRRQEARP